MQFSNPIFNFRLLRKIIWTMRCELKLILPYYNSRKILVEKMLNRPRWTFLTSFFNLEEFEYIALFQAVTQNYLDDEVW